MLAIPKSEITIAKSEQGVDQADQLVDLFFAALLQFLLVEHFGGREGDVRRPSSAAPGPGRRRRPSATLTKSIVSWVWSKSRAITRWVTRTLPSTPSLESNSPTTRRPGRARVWLEQPEAVADLEAVGGGEVVGDDRLAVARGCAGCCGPPCSHSMFDRLADVARGAVDPGLARPACRPAFASARADRRHQLDPGHPPAAFAAPLGIGEKPSLFWITRPPAKFSSTTWATELFSPAAKTVTKATSARPIISAAAVTAVRLGLRCAFSRARRPVRRAQPLQRPAGDRRQRRHQAGAEERDARRRSPPRRRPSGRRRCRRSAPPKRPTSSIASPADAEQDRERQVERPAAPGRRRLEGVQGGDRRHPGRAQRRDQRGDEGDDDADQQRDDDRPRLQSPGSVVGRSMPIASKRALSSIGDQEAAADARAAPRAARSPPPRPSPW